MNKTERRKMIASIVVNMMMAILAVGGFFIMHFMGSDGDFVDSGVNLLKYYTVLSNLYLGLTALMISGMKIYSLARNQNCIPRWAQVIYYTGIMGILFTFVIIIVVLTPMDVMKGRSIFRYMFYREFVCMHFFNPVLAIVSYFFLDLKPRIRFKEIFFAPISVLFYMAFYSTNSVFRYWGVMQSDGTKSYDWYHLCGDGNVWQAVLVSVGLICLAYGFSVLLWKLNGISYHYFEGYEDNEGRLLHDERNLFNGILLKNLSKDLSFVPVYHVSKKVFCKKWQIRLSRERKPLALFSNPESAIQYALGQAKKTNGVVRVHCSVSTT